MNRFYRELRRREVFRTTGLYVGVCWILIEVSSVMLPTFDAPDWMMRAIIITAMVGFPVMLVLAWVYNLTEHGIEVQADPTDTIIAPLGSRKMDFVAIGVLSVALILSVYMNLNSGPKIIEQLEPLSVLIADFDNQTGDPLFEGSLEQALNIGIEGASFITAYSRVTAKDLVEKLSPGTPLDAEGARLVAVREGIKIVISGSIAEDDGRYKLEVDALHPETGELASHSSVTAKTKLEVLGAVNELAEDLRKDLGDTSIGGEGSVLGETFTATSLEALQNYTVAQELAITARYEESLPYYEAAVAEDPDFGRALSGWALSLFYLGQQEKAARLWEQALSKMGGMTARERHRTLGLYYLAIAGNYEKGIESYTALVEEFPADSAGYNNLAIAYFSTLDFQKAREAGRKALDIYPTNKVMLSNYALFAMYAGDFATAEKQARDLLDIDENYFMAWLPIAMSAAADGDIAAVLQHYDSMSEIDAQGAALARLGKADLAQFTGDFAGAAELVNTGIQRQELNVAEHVLAASYLVLARSQQSADDNDGARASIAASLAIAAGTSTQVAAALLSIDSGDLEVAKSYGEKLSKKLQSHARAYGKLIEGGVAMSGQDSVAAIDAIRAGTEFADLWLLRFYLGRAYLQGGFFAEAMDEFMLCEERRGEATAIFLNDLPTWRYMAALPYWLGRAQQGLGMTDAASTSFQKFLDTYQADDSLARDAKIRLQ